MSQVCKCGHHRTVHVGLTEQSRCTQCHCDTFKLPVTEERQPNTELREKAREWLDEQYPEYDYPLRRSLEEKWNIDLTLILAAFAASIQEEARKPAREGQPSCIECHKYARRPGTDTCSEYCEGYRAGSDAAEKQLAEALAERDELAAQVNHDCAFHDEMALTNQIHNRFCGENGKPCQVCRLKAEKEK